MRKLILLFLSLSIHAVAYELSNPYLDLMDTKYSLQIFTLGNDQIKWASDLNMYEKQSDGSILAPAIGQQKDGRNTNIVWVNLNCNNNNVIILENFNNGSFSRAINSNGNDVAFTLRQYYCPTITDVGKKLLAYGSIVNPDGKSFNYVGWYPEEITLNDAKEIVVKLYAYAKRTEKLDIQLTGDAVLNCTSKTVNINNTSALSTDSGRKDTRFLLNTACQFNDVLKMSAFNIPINFKDNNSKLDIDKAKLKCKAKGLKEKTEKFGACVLENLN
jgi:hypothetical protein